MTFNAINWNRVEDSLDKEVWERLTSNFWLPEKVPLSNDIQSWNNLSDAEKDLTMKVFTGLTLLDTLQGTVGAVELMKDSVTQHEEAVYTNIAFMEALSGETELLTPQGWTRIDGVTADTVIGQFDPDSKGISFTKPVAVSHHYEEEIYEIASNQGGARQIVSGGHRVYLEEKVGSDWAPKVYEAREVNGLNLNASRRFRSTGIAQGERKMTVEDRLKIAIQADGSFKSGSTPRCTGSVGGHIPVMFTLTKDRKKERLRQLATEAGWNLTERDERNGRTFFRLAVPMEHIGDREKHFDAWWSLDSLSLEWCSDFLEESSLWDGHQLKNPNHGIEYVTIDKRNADFYVAVATLANRRSRVDKREDDRSENFSNTYCVYVTKDRTGFNGPSMKVNRMSAREVYCVQVPTTFLVTRNGSTPVITGNCVHAKSYSAIFSTLSNTKDIDEAFRWSRENLYLQKKAEIVYHYYKGDDPFKKKIASVLLESFLFYSGFYLPLYFSTHSRLTNTADLIRLIIRDEGVHGYYIGAKYQQSIRSLSGPTLQAYEDFTYSLLSDLYENEIKYTESLYDDIGWTEDVKKFLAYNANKALNNLGYEALFPSEVATPNPAVMGALSLGSESHDFFSGSGSSYVIAKTEVTDDTDWDF